MLTQYFCEIWCGANGIFKMPLGLDRMLSRGTQGQLTLSFHSGDAALKSLGYCVIEDSSKTWSKYYGGVGSITGQPGVDLAASDPKRAADPQVTAAEN